MTRSPATRIAPALVAVSLATAVAAQDAHYWTDQFGNRARLLGGAVVGSARDLSATYYNPGGLALVPSAEILLAGNVFTFTAYQAATPDGGALTSSSLSLSPSLLAGEVPRDVVGNNRLAYSFLKRQSAGFRLQGRGSRSGEALGFPGLELIADNVQVEQALSESWFGVTWSYKAAERVGLGVTTYLTARSQSVQFQQFSQALGVNGRAGAVIRNRQFDFNHYGLLWKIGLAAQSETWGVGVTVTTPRVPLAGTGATAFDATAVGQDIDADGNAITEVATNTQADLPSHFESPLSIAIGGTLGLGTARLHLTGEWFAPVGAFVVLPSEPFAGQSSGELIDTAITRELSDVFNVAVGLENRFSDKLTVYASFRTDLSGFEARSAAPLPVGDWDIHHLAGGATFAVGRSKVTAGAIVSFGDSTTGRIFEPVVGGDTSDRIAVDYLRLSFLIGYDFSFEGR